ncbi:MAG: hypothetical protein M1827_006902 [Pycnora praestabilis]|nr:MAG: hypothetical protein M1827_006902 [Pycnora praestabilis]
MRRQPRETLHRGTLDTKSFDPDYSSDRPSHVHGQQIPPFEGPSRYTTDSTNVNTRPLRSLPTYEQRYVQTLPSLSDDTLSNENIGPGAARYHGSQSSGRTILERQEVSETRYAKQFQEASFSHHSGIRRPERSAVAYEMSLDIPTGSCSSQTTTSDREPWTQGSEYMQQEADFELQLPTDWPTIQPQVPPQEELRYSTTIASPRSSFGASSKIEMNVISEQKGHEQRRTVNRATNGNTTMSGSDRRGDVRSGRHQGYPVQVSQPRCPIDCYSGSDVPKDAHSDADTSKRLTFGAIREEISVKNPSTSQINREQRDDQHISYAGLRPPQREYRTPRQRSREPKVPPNQVLKSYSGDGSINDPPRPPFDYSPDFPRSQLSPLIDDEGGSDVETYLSEPPNHGEEESGLSYLETSSYGLTPRNCVTVVQADKKGRTKSYHCNDCERSFTQKPDLDRHGVSVHNKHGKRYRCTRPVNEQKCSRIFARRDNLRDHLKRIHDLIDKDTMTRLLNEGAEADEVDFAG